MYREYSDADEGCRTSFIHDINDLSRWQTLYVNEYSSVTNWQPVAKLRTRYAHTVLASNSCPWFRYCTIFSLEKSRGSSEKFHGAVVDHCGHEHTRVFKRCTDVGNILKN